MFAGRGVEPVCPEPKIFIGQVPLDSSKDDILRVFGQYGTMTNVILLRGDGQKPQSAMVVYSTWASVESACETENGTMSLGGTNGKPLVVRIADPPKRAGDTAIAPKKLFVGQIPTTVTEVELRNLFAPYGNIMDLCLLKKNPGAACAFVTYERWSQCEAAIAAHTGKTMLDGAKMAMIVKFADAKVEGGGFGGMNAKRPFNDGGPGFSNKKQFNGMMGVFNGYSMPGMPPGIDVSPMAMAQMGGMGGMGGMGYGMGMNQMMGMGGMQPQQGMGMQQPQGMGGMQPQGMGMQQPQGMGMQQPQGLGMQQPQGMGMQQPQGMGMQQPQQGMGMQPQQGMGRGMGGGMGGGMGFSAGFAGGNGMGPRGGRGGPGQASQSSLGSGVTDSSSKQWKLFVGQVPFEAQESDLWPLFCELGNIQELVILRGHDGRSKGCAFLTFEAQASADAAIEQVHGKMYLPNDPNQRVLIVKFASRTQSPGMAPGGAGVVQQGMAAGVGGMGLQGMGQQGMGQQGMGQQGMGGMGGGVAGMQGMMGDAALNPNAAMAGAPGHPGMMAGVASGQDQQGYHAAAYAPQQQQQAYTAAAFGGQQ